MGIIDFLIAPIYIIIAYLVLIVNHTKFTTPLTQRFFLKAFTAKVIGFIAFGFIYQYYYGGGDTFNYFNSSKIIADIIYEDPIKGLRVLLLNSGDTTSPLYPLVKGISLFNSPEEWNVIKYGAVGAVLCFKSYLGVCLFFTLFSFIGMWRLYSLFAELYPEITKSLGWIMLFAPSTIFWGSAVMKDTLALGAICFLFSSILGIFIFKRSLILNGVIILLCTFLLISIKVYLLLCAFPAIGIWWFIKISKGIKLLAVKLVVVPIILGILAGAVFFGIRIATAQSNTFSSLDSIGKKIQGFHQDHGTRTTGSTYTLGEIDYSLTGFLSKAPISIRIALFQPFPWEVKNIVMLLSSFESSFYLFLTLFIIYKRGFLNFIKPIYSHPEVAMCTTFTFILAYIVGFTSFNYGALVRFKIPFLPFLGCALVLIYYLPKYQLAQQVQEAYESESSYASS